MSFWSFITNLFGKQAAPTAPSIPVVPEPIPAPQNIPVPTPPVPEKPLITSAQLQAIMPNCPQGQLEAFAGCLCVAMKEGEINTVQRIACFIGQVAHESNQLREWSENLNYSVKALMTTWPHRFPTIEAAQPYAYQPVKLANYVYANRLGNGDVASGDGWRYRGRSPMQLTGKGNYQNAGAALGVDLVNNPDSAASPSIGFRIAVWYWSARNLNALADRMDIVGITKAINGGTIGLAAREAFTKKALAVLGV